MTPLHTSSKGVQIYAWTTREGNLQYITQHGDLIWDTSQHDPEVLFLALAADAAPACGPAGYEDGIDDMGEPIDDTPRRQVLYRRHTDPGYEKVTK